MKTHRGLFDTLVTAEHIDRAIRLAARGKRRRADVAWFLFRRDAERMRITEELADGTWSPVGFELLFIRDPKRRVISRAPFCDRVVHTALVELLEPVFGPSMMPEDLACRTGGGTHRALLAVQRNMRRHRFCVHLDVKGCFYSVDLDILRSVVARKVRDRAFLAVLDRVLDSGAGLVDRPGVREWLGMAPDWPPVGGGLPVGAQTSQFLLTHVYLQRLDHVIKRQLKVPGYVRYVDDLVLFGDRRADLRRWRAAVGDWLWEHRRQRLKHPNARLLSCGGTLHVLGHRVRRGEIRAGGRALRRFKNRVDGAMTAPKKRGRSEHLERSMAASVGLLLGP